MQELIMGSVLNNASLIHDDDSIGMTHRAEAMCNHQCGAIGSDVHQGPLNRCFGVVVNGSCGLIEHQDRSIFEDGSGKGDALSLST